MNATLLSGSIFTPSQVAAMVVVGVVIALLIAVNIAIFIIYKRKQERKLCTSQLQNKRLELLHHLKNITDDGSLMKGAPVMYAQVDDEPEEEEMTDDGDEAGDDDDDDEKADEAPIGEGEDITQNDILAVADMSEYTRRKLGYFGDEYDRKRYYVRYTLGFDAKLRAADDEVKARYNELLAEFKQFKGVKVKTSFRQQRIYKGRKTLAIVLFRGKTLCVAFALNPKEYAETKYRGIDKSDKKRFEKTPMLYKLTSVRRVEYAKYLILQLADINVMVLDEKPDLTPVDLSTRTPDELYVANALRITVLGEAPELEPEPEPELTVEDTLDGEAAATADSDKDDEGEEDIEFDTPEGRMVFDRSFTARIIQADDALKARYSELKNYILGYKGVKNRISWRRETYSMGRKTVAMFSVRGKTLCLYLAADPTRFDNSKYNVENMSETASRRKTPLLFRIKSDRRTAYAKQLIDIVMQESGATKTERRPTDYTTPYRSTDALVKRGLIRITQTTAKHPFGTTAKK